MSIKIESIEFNRAGFDALCNAVAATFSPRYATYYSPEVEIVTYRPEGHCYDSTELRLLWIDEDGEVGCTEVHPMRFNDYDICRSVWIGVTEITPFLERLVAVAKALYGGDAIIIN